MRGCDLYIILAIGQKSNKKLIKIGRSKDVHKRLKQLQTGCPYKLKLLVEGKGLGHRELELHNRLSSHRKNGEWFDSSCVSDLPDVIYALIPEADLVTLG